MSRHARAWAGAALVVALMTAPAARGAELDEHDGSRGVWVRTRAVEAFVATDPRFRVLAIRRPGEASLLADAKATEQGVRLAYMDPAGQVPASFDPGNQPAEIIERSPSAVRVRLGAAAGLRYDVAVTLDDDRPIVRLSCALTNVGAAPRRAAPWVVAAYDRAAGGTIVVPFGPQPKALRRIVLSWWTRWPQPGARFGRDALALDVAAPLDGNAMKIGVTTESGWGAIARGDRTMIVAVDHVAGGDYPEGGANVTVFNAGWSEIEHVGPLRELRPNEAARIEATLTLAAIDAATAKDNADALRAAVEPHAAAPAR